MAAHLEDFVADLRATAAAIDNPVARFWAVTERYLRRVLHPGSPVRDVRAQLAEISGIA